MKRVRRNTGVFSISQQLFFFFVLWHFSSVCKFSAENAPVDIPIALNNICARRRRLCACQKQSSKQTNQQQRDREDEADKGQHEEAQNRMYLCLLHTDVRMFMYVHSYIFEHLSIGCHIMSNRLNGVARFSLTLSLILVIITSYIPIWYLWTKRDRAMFEINLSNESD